MEALIHVSIPNDRQTDKWPSSCIYLMSAPQVAAQTVNIHRAPNSPEEGPMVWKNDHPVW